MDAINPYFKRSMDITVFLLVDSRGPSAKIRRCTVGALAAHVAVSRGPSATHLIAICRV